MKLYLLILVVVMGGCRHPKEKQIVKTQDGKFYILEEAVCDNCYRLKEVDTSAINKLSK